MKLQRSTGILLGVAIALVATVTLIETQKSTQTDNDNTLYDFAEADVKAFTIELDDSTITFNKTNDTWQMTQPESAEADPSAIAFLLNILTSSTIKETITTTSDQLNTYGLDDPVAIVTLDVYDTNYTLKVGDQDFSSTALYVVSNENAQNSESIDIHLISNNLENGLKRSLEEWQND